MITSTKTPNVQWAQDKKSLFLTIQLQDCTDTKLVLEQDKIEFSGESQGQHYSFSLKLYGKVENWKKVETSRSIQLFCSRLDQKFWPRLTENKEKLNWLKIDFSRYADEDEEEEDDSKPDFSKMMMDMGEMGNIMPRKGEELDSDDEIEEEEAKA